VKALFDVNFETGPATEGSITETRDPSFL